MLLSGKPVLVFKSGLSFFIFIISVLGFISYIKEVDYDHYYHYGRCRLYWQ